MDVKDVLLGSSEYAVRVMGLVGFLLHCIASNLVLEILKHGKICGDNSSGVPRSNVYGYSTRLRPEIYAHVLKYLRIWRHKRALCHRQL